MCEAAGGSKTEAVEEVRGQMRKMGEDSLRPPGWNLSLGQGQFDGHKSGVTCGIQTSQQPTPVDSLCAMPHAE